MDKMSYLKKLQGAIKGRFAGCCLGAPVELIGFNETIDYANKIGFGYPPEKYWPESPRGNTKRYINGTFNEFTSSRMKYLPADDDIIYTVLSLLILEKYGTDFTTEDVAEIWLELLPEECTFTAERITLKNLRNGILPWAAGEYENPDKELIGAAIRCDGWAYVNPGSPQKATDMAHRDAWLTHRGAGLHSAEYFAAVIASAFVSVDIHATLYDCMKFVPQDSFFRSEIEWALSISSDIHNYEEAYHAVTSRHPDMNPVHSINNACLTVWGVLLGKDDFSKGISQTVAMGYDNDCTAATVGSILGAYMGIDKIPSHWYEPWNDLLKSYLIDKPEFSIDDIIKRFYKLAC